MLYEELSPSASNLYSELYQQVTSSEAQRTLANLNGTFSCKTVKEKRYWYLQFNEAGHQKQVYLGAENPSLLEIIERHKQGKQEIQTDLSNRQRLCSMLMKGGVQTLDSVLARVIELLGNSGVFRLGGVLVGSHAFITYTSLLGVRWSRVTRTQDVDIAQAYNVSVALAKDVKAQSLPDALEQAKMGFHPVPSFHRKHPSTSFKIRGKEIHLDLLTPMTGKEDTTPVTLPSFKAAAQPLRFLDYLIENPVPAVVVYNAGILVNVPQPARFAFHKLIVAEQRTITSHLKKKKDLEQAAALFAVLLKNRKGDVLLAWDDLKVRGQKWIKACLAGLKSMERLHPSLANELQPMIRSSCG